MAWSKTYPHPEPQRVNKWLAAEGVCSRREAEGLIAQGLVSIDGARVDYVGRKIERGQTLTLAGKAQAQLEGALTIVLNKPVRYVSAQPQGDEVAAARLLTKANLWNPERAVSWTAGVSPATDGAMAKALPARTPAVQEARAPRLPTSKTSLAPLGRLDQDSRGLLLLSEDGVLAKAVIGPHGEMEKEYRVRVAGRIDARKLALLRHGLVIDGRALKQAQVDAKGDMLRFVLREGMKRQIRRMCEAVELRVLDLQRVRIGPLKLGELPEGKWRLLTSAERAALIASG